MEVQKWKRVEYDTWDAAFKALLPVVRQQSVRVAAYARELYVQACAMNFGKQTQEGQDRIHGRYADVIYKCGMYHQLGKALVPPEYQVWQEDFKPEEEVLFRKYTSDGRTLVAMLQLRGARSRGMKKGAFEEPPTENIPWLMIRECCQQHMERWDGSGYPDGRKGDQISAPAQIVGLAKELDILVSGTRSEDPFQEAMELLISQSGTLWNPELIEVLQAAREQCYEVYQKYIHYSLTLPKTIPLVERSKDRAMGLSYRPILGVSNGKIMAFEATPWFAGIADRPGEVERLGDVTAMLHTTGIAGDVAFYFMYEAADTILRMRNCKLDVDTLMLQVPEEFFNATSRLKGLTQLFEDQPIDRRNLWLMVPEALVQTANKATLENITRYIRSGMVLVLDGFHPDVWEPEKLKELGFTHLRLAPETCMQSETADSIHLLKTWGFQILGCEVDTREKLGWLVENGAVGVSGPITGPVTMEDEMIRDCIVRQYR